MLYSKSLTKSQKKQDIANLFIKWLKQNTGKGPQKIKVKILDDSIEVLVEEILTCLEKNLIKDRSNIKLIQEVRNTFYKAQSSKLASQISEIMNKIMTVDDIQESLLEDKVKFIIKIE
ncbi:Na-translocating system protein MpsC family protein [Clostridiaceae bacterium 35-E11]